MTPKEIRLAWLRTIGIGDPTCPFTEDGLALAVGCSKSEAHHAIRAFGLIGTWNNKDAGVHLYSFGRSSRSEVE